MIYVCLTTRNNSETAGLVLWKIRQVFEDYPREYQILVADDGSSDDTPRVLATYQRALPMTLVSRDAATGHAAILEMLLREVLARTDRPRRDLAITVPADFSASPAVIPDIVKRFESGADLIIGDCAGSDPSLGMRLVRRSAPWLLRPGLSVPGVRDPASSVCAMRLITLKRAVDHAGDRLLACEGVSANAELIARVAAQARQVNTVPVPATPHAVRATPPEGPLQAALGLFRAGKRVQISVAVSEKPR